MKIKSILLLLLVANPAWATGEPQPVDRAVAVSGSHSAALAQSKSASSSESVAGAIAKGGSGGSATGGSIGDTDNQSSVGDITYKGDENPRQAPAVAVLPQQSTALGLKCVGIGMSQSRSDDAWGGGAGWCWKQRDDWAVARYTQLSNMGLFTEASKAYCGQKFHWQDFGSVEACEAGIYQALIDQQVAGQVIYEETVTVEQCDSEKAVIVGRVVEECKRK